MPQRPLIPAGTDETSVGAYWILLLGGFFSVAPWVITGQMFSGRHPELAQAIEILPSMYCLWITIARVVAWVRAEDARTGRARRDFEKFEEAERSSFVIDPRQN